MAERKSFLLRVEKEMLDTLQGWADDELRSLNGQIEYLLRDALRKAGRLKALPGRAAPPGQLDSPESAAAPTKNDPPDASTSSGKENA